jgi:hypothetical protein
MCPSFNFFRIRSLGRIKRGASRFSSPGGKGKIGGNNYNLHLDTSNDLSWSGFCGQRRRDHSQKRKPSVHKSSEMCGIQIDNAPIHRLIPKNLFGGWNTDANTYTYRVFHYMLWWCKAELSMLKK